MSHNFHEDLSRPLVVRRSSDRSLGFALTILLFAVGMWPLLRHNHVVRHDQERLTRLLLQEFVQRSVRD